MPAIVDVCGRSRDLEDGVIIKPQVNSGHLFGSSLEGPAGMRCSSYKPGADTSLAALLFS
jgi:hypothetical protein